MNTLSRLIRIIRIQFILLRYGIDDIILQKQRFIFLKLFVYLNPGYWAYRNRPQAERLRLAITALGPLFVKAAQLLTTRRDVLSEDIANELSKLQDQVPPFCGKRARAIIEHALQYPIDSVFTDFQETALASASIAQVHSAKLLNGEEVVIKVLRPNIANTIARDTDLLMTLASLLERYSKQYKQLKPKALVKEISQTLHEELDLMREAANASQLKRHFENSRDLYIPKIHWAYCRNGILVMERIHGIPIHDITQLKHANVNMKKLAERLLKTFFTQVFRDSYFHADLHPGNIFVSHDHPNDPSIILVDFGIVGSLSQKDQRYMAENLLAFFKRDYQRVAELHITCGWLPPHTRVDQFESAIRAVSEPIFSQPLHEISFGKLLLRLFQVAHQFNINIQPQLILLQKTLVSVEGLCRNLAPELDIWQTVTPMLEKWMRDQLGIRAFLKRVKENLPLWSEQLPALPTMIYEWLRKRHP